MMLMGDIIDVFRKGKSVANPAVWKNLGATSAALAGLASSALAVAAAFGYRIDLDDATVQALAGGIAGALYLFSSGVHIATSEKVGLPSKTDSDTGRGQSAVGEIGSGPDYRG